MRVLVTGASGNVGVTLVRHLAEEPSIGTIVGVATRPPKDWQPPGVEWHARDLASDRLDGLLEGIDAVVHLAWQLQPTRDVRDLHRTNILGTQRLLAATGRARVRAIVAASSVGAYSPAPRTQPPVTEAWPTHGTPTSAYSRQKAYVERLLDVHERDHPGTRVVRMRTAVVLDPEAASQQRRFFLGSLLPNRAVRPAAIPLIPDVLRLQVVHARDVADAYRRAVLQDVRGAFNVAAPPVLTNDRLASILEARPVSVPERALRLAVRASWRLRMIPVDVGWLDMGLSVPIMATDRVRDELGWQPTVDAEEAVRAAMAAIRAGRGGPTPTLEPDDERARASELATRQGARYRDG